MKRLSGFVSISLCLLTPLSFTLSNSAVAQTAPPAAQGAIAPTASIDTPSIDTPSIDTTSARFKAGDRLRLTVVGFPDLSGEQVLSTEGTLQLPLAGSVPIGGLTLAEATNQITQALLPYVRRPQVGLAIVSLSPIRISVTGEVVQPGPRVLAATETENNTSIPLSRALTLAGGITPNADLRNITIRRHNPTRSSDPLAAQPASEVTVNLWEAIESGSLASDIKIYNDDEIVVPTAQAGSANQQALASTLAPGKIIVSVSGEVRTPGQVELSAASGVSAAVSAAGGFTENASQSQILLLRMLPDGRMESRAFDFGNTSEPLQNGDLIVVQQSERGRTNGFFDFLGNILSPITPLIRLLVN